ncbi:hypothetical protein BH10PSE8_BH10PSE8_13760 [soil metagenome]
MAKVVDYIDDSTFFVVEMGVGPGRANNRDDVALVQYFLNLWFKHPANAGARAVAGVASSAMLKVDGLIGPKTKSRIKAFQTAMVSRGISVVRDGCVDKMKDFNWIFIDGTNMAVYTIFYLNIEIKQLYENELVRLNFRDDYPPILMRMLYKYVAQIGAEAA